MRVEYVEIGELKKYPKNPKLHDLESLGASMDEHGFVDPIVVDERTGMIGAGHGRIEELERRRDAGEKPPERVVIVGGKWHVPVLRGVAFKDDESFRRYVIGANRISEIGGWDNKLLSEMLTGLDKTSLLSTGFNEKDVVKFMTLTHEPTGGKTSADQDVEPPAKVITKRGDVWLLGRHRLLCGDATDRKDVTLLMQGEQARILATDPPYGVNYNDVKAGIPNSGFEGDRFKDWGDIVNDDLTPEKMGPWLDKVFALARGVLTKNSAVYVWHPGFGELAHAFYASLVRAGFVVHRQIIWRKPGFVLTRSGMYHWAHECCYYGWRKGDMPPWLGEKNQTSVWDVGRDDGKAVHPTQKPVELFERPMMNHALRGEVVYEPFSGSGSAIIAGERQDRRVFAMDISPRWVDAAVARWEAFTGKKAVREGGGRRKKTRTAVASAS